MKNSPFVLALGNTIELRCIGPEKMNPVINDHVAGSPAGALALTDRINRIEVFHRLDRRIPNRVEKRFAVGDLGVDDADAVPVTLRILEEAVIVTTHLPRRHNLDRRPVAERVSHDVGNWDVSHDEPHVARLHLARYSMRFVRVLRIKAIAAPARSGQLSQRN